MSDYDMYTYTYARLVPSIVPTLRASIRRFELLAYLLAISVSTGTSFVTFQSRY